jgi:hypothetical protein
MNWKPQTCVWYWLCFCNYKIHFIVVVSKNSGVAAICGRYLWNALWHTAVHRGGVGLKNGVVGARCPGDVWQTRGEVSWQQTGVGIGTTGSERGVEGWRENGDKIHKACGICSVSFRDNVQIWRDTLKCCDMCTIYFTWNYLNIGCLSGENSLASATRQLAFLPSLLCAPMGWHVTSAALLYSHEYKFLFWLLGCVAATYNLPNRSVTERGRSRGSCIQWTTFIDVCLVCNFSVVVRLLLPI